LKKTLIEFKKFAIQGNVFDMAVGVIIGGAFGRIVTSFVNDIVMPFISLLTGRVTLSELRFIIPSLDPNVQYVSINYGQLLQNVFDFLIIAIIIFMMVKVAKRIREKYLHNKPEEPKKPSREEELLIEIRDMLNNEKAEKSEP